MLFSKSCENVFTLSFLSSFSFKELLWLCSGTTSTCRTTTAWEVSPSRPHCTRLVGSSSPTKRWGERDLTKAQLLTALISVCFFFWQHRQIVVYLTVSRVRTKHLKNSIQFSLHPLLGPVPEFKFCFPLNVSLSNTQHHAGYFLPFC